MWILPIVDTKGPGSKSASVVKLGCVIVFDNAI